MAARTISEQTADPATHSRGFQVAELRSEAIRVTALLAVFLGLLVLVVVRGILSLSQGVRGEAWPFALLLAVILAYEVYWLKCVRQAIDRGAAVTRARWIANTFIESLVPTIAVLLQVHTTVFGPYRALASPIVLSYFLLIMLSTLHLDPVLSRLAGGFSAGGYAAVALYVYLRFPEVATGEQLVIYGSASGSAILIAAGGFAAGTVAQQIRLYVLATLHDAENRAKLAQYEHDLSIARSVQQGLLPKSIPCVTGFDVAGWNHPADETGGDYFDWQDLPDGRLAVSIADATGHGIGPALVMSTCRAYARAGFAMQMDLRVLLCRLNQLLYADLPAEKFVTLAAGVLDPRDSAVHLISAGHGPLVFYSFENDRFYDLDAQGPPLGLLPNVGYQSGETLVCGPGDILVMVTDGFVEWTNANDEDFGLDRLHEVIRTHRSQPAATIIAELQSAVLEFAGSTPQMDDLTALVVKRANDGAGEKG